MPNLIDPHPTYRANPRAVRMWMEDGVYPYGWNGFIVGSRVIDRGTQIENFRSAIAYALVKQIIRKERKNQ